MPRNGLTESLRRVAPQAILDPSVDESPDPWDVIAAKLAEAATPPAPLPAPAPRVTVEPPDLSELLAAVQASRVDGEALATLITAGIAAGVAAVLEQQPDMSAPLAAIVQELEALRKKFRAVASGGGGGGPTEVGLRAGADQSPVSEDNPLPVSVVSEPDEAEPIPVTATYTTAGAHTLYTPTPGTAVKLKWISAVNDPDSSDTPLVTVTLGAKEPYRLYAFAHREWFTGEVDEPLVVTLDGVGSVSVTAHVYEVTP